MTGSSAGRPAKLDPATCADIRAMVAAGMTQTSVAARYGIDQSTVSRVCGRKGRFADDTRECAGTASEVG